MTQQPSQTCANPHTQPILNFRSLFCSAEQKNNNDGNGRKWSAAQRRSEAETQTRHVRALSGVIPPIQSGARACSRAGRSRSEAEARRGAERE